MAEIAKEAENVHLYSKCFYVSGKLTGKTGFELPGDDLDRVDFSSRVSLTTDF